ncbi:MAG: hypothetical protein KatS3mg094_613 [Candidatus Parcubacteria bacterium]|nr:MAG: hypothetical protein KatS3mg094_613 [Candidatus Parcubacteria bacterium]
MLSKIKIIYEKLAEWGVIIFVGLIFIAILLYFLNYFNNLQLLWIVIFVVLGWLIYIYRYLEEEHFNKKENNN